MLSGWSASSYRNTAQLSAISAQVTIGVPRLGMVSRMGIMRSPCKNTPRNHYARGERMTTVAFIGLGAMGSRMAMNLHQAGFKLKVWNRDRAKTKSFAEKGIAVADSPADAARGAEFAVSIVADDVATREVMLGASGVIGDKAAVDKAQPVYAGMGRMVRRIGESGAGATLKLINNMLAASLQVALAEGAQVAEAANLDRAAAMEVLNEGAAGSRVLKNKLPKIFNRDFTPQFQLELMDKDVRYFVQLAAELDRPAPLASLVRSQFQAARRAQLGKLDSS